MKRAGASDERKLHVLVVEDVEDFAVLLVYELKKGGFAVSYERVDTAETMAEALGRGPWDIILSDYVMPRFSAHDALALLKEKDADIPVIVVTGKMKEDLASQVMKAGARDFISKQNLARLVPAVRRELECAQTRRKAKQGGLI
jgi:DNA-binding NtrC family response regulator